MKERWEAEAFTGWGELNSAGEPDPYNYEYTCEHFDNRLDALTQRLKEAKIQGFYDHDGERISNRREMMVAWALKGGHITEAYLDGLDAPPA